MYITPEKQLAETNSLRERKIVGFNEQMKSPTSGGRNSTLGRIQSARRIEADIFPKPKGSREQVPNDAVFARITI